MQRSPYPIKKKTCLHQDFKQLGLATHFLSGHKAIKSFLSRVITENACKSKFTFNGTCVDSRHTNLTLQPSLECVIGKHVYMSQTQAKLQNPPDRRKVRIRQFIRTAREMLLNGLNWSFASSHKRFIQNCSWQLKCFYTFDGRFNLVRKLDGVINHCLLPKERNIMIVIAHFCIVF